MKTPYQIIRETLDDNQARDRSPGTQQELADAVGIDKTQLSRMLNRRTGGQKHMPAIAKVLGLKLDDLVTPAWKRTEDEKFHNRAVKARASVGPRPIGSMPSGTTGLTAITVRIGDQEFRLPYNGEAVTVEFD